MDGRTTGGRGEEAVEGRGWETSTNSRLVTLKMLLASTLLVIACVCVCVRLNLCG